MIIMLNLVMDFGVMTNQEIIWIVEFIEILWSKLSAFCDKNILLL